MPERSKLVNMIFGRLTWEATPYHEPILSTTLVAVALVGLMLVGTLAYFRLWGYLWRK